MESPEQNIITYEYFYNGGGVAAADFNNDGLTDLFFTSNQQPDKLYLNKGNWNFQDISRPAGVEGRAGWKTGVSVADVNGDGYLDIYVCYSGNVEPRDRRNQLFINNKNLTFTKKAEEYGVADAGYSTQAVFFDFDRDGDLDLFVINHNIRNLRNFNAAFVKKMIDADAGDRLYENRDNGLVMGENIGRLAVKRLQSAVALAQKAAGSAHSGKRAGAKEAIHRPPPATSAR